MRVRTDDGLVRAFTERLQRPEEGLRRLCQGGQLGRVEVGEGQSCEAIQVARNRRIGGKWSGWSVQCVEIRY